MFQSFINVFKIKDLRRRILFVFLMLIVVRLGSGIPVAGVDPDVFKNLFSAAGDSMSFFDAITGGSFEKMSIFALSITPYITSSIIMQLLTIAIPKLEEMQRDGEQGRKKMTQITRIVTVALAVLESTAMAIGFGQNGYLTEFNALYVILVIAVLTGGSTVLMWIGEQITEHGIGNRIPSDLTSLYEQFIQGKIVAKGILSGLIIAAVIIGTVVLVVYLQNAERKIPVQYSKKMQGRRTVGGNSTFIPLKVNTAGVIPVIFASSLISVPGLIAQIIKNDTFTLIVQKYLTMTTPVGFALYMLFIFFFAYFYTFIQLKPDEFAKNLQENGGYIPGIRPGDDTEKYVSKVLSRLTVLGAVFLIIIAGLPIIFSKLTSLPTSVSIGGTGLLIVVGVALEVYKQLEGSILTRSYKRGYSRR